MIHDRGSKKWVSLMLPEHVQALKKLWAEEEQRERPLLDEQQIIINNLALQRALQEDQLVIVKHYANNDVLMTKGKVACIDTLNKCFQLNDTLIQLENIIEVELL